MRKSGLPKGIYGEEAYPHIVQQRWAALRPILKLAKGIPDYKGKCKLD